jgi:hypothetical protein
MRRKWIIAGLAIWHFFVSELSPRIAGKQLYTGTVRYVDGSNITGTASNANTGLDPLFPKLTLTSAYSASSDTGIIELISNLDLKNESGGYWLVNTANKGVLVRGKSGSTIVVTHTGASPTFLIRMVNTNKLQFQNLTFSHNQIKELFYVECDSPSVNVTKWLKLKNCVFDFQNASINIPSLIRPVNITTSGTGDIFFEADSCTLPSTKTSGYQWFGTSGLPTTATYLINGCTFNSNGFATLSSGDTNKAKYCLYDNTINQAAGGTVLSFSSDTSAPTNLGQIVDLRNNTLVVADTFDPHGILLGRGTNSVYCVNNKVTIPSTSSSLAIGFVIKTRSTNIGDSYIAGNYCVAPRPYYIKGGSKVTLSFNSGISNYSTRAGLDVDNPVESDMPNGINSTLNVVTHNNFLGNFSGISLLTTAATEKVATSMQGWTINNNKYYSLTDIYLYNSQISQPYRLQESYSIFGNQNEFNSKMINFYNFKGV